MAHRPEQKTHPLAQPWTLWFDNPSGKQKVSNFGETLRPICTFDTVEDFWSLQHNLAQPSQLKPNADIHLFKDGITPKWEDPMNEDGGRWTVTIPKTGEDRALNAFWLDAMLACVGEMFEDGSEVCGVVCNIRNKGNRVCMWTSKADKKALQLSLGRQFKHHLGIGPSEKISYLAHSDARRLTQTQRATDLYTI
ncbi:unnamed protein product [Ostreobium quekettii]|uniref:eIF-4F 25 kDa subunit n=1 Tax=Ostreobium quekettii TaxID=121088 RepID=A0A8S1JH74_9CHLO|nr:unnamed protein product [Ostreobium quekettii]|eukprot:evm.model.scf_881EXC.5 EVM.evm.TU.scf_881EXC.5   scf_881EXC:32292-34392(-)